MQCHWLPNSIPTEDIDLSIGPRKNLVLVGVENAELKKISAELHPESGWLCHPSHAATSLLIHSPPDSANWEQWMSHFTKKYGTENLKKQVKVNPENSSTTSSLCTLLTGKVFQSFVFHLKTPGLLSIVATGSFCVEQSEENCSIKYCKKIFNSTFNTALVLGLLH